MEKINSSDHLRAAILELENRQHEEEKLMKKNFKLTYESIKPVNLILSTLKEASESKELRNNLLNTSVGLAAGYVSKSLFEGRDHSPIRKLIGSAMMFGITNVITKNPTAVKAVALTVLKMMRIEKDKKTNRDKNKLI